MRRQRTGRLDRAGRAQRGVALLVVLWLGVMLAVIAGGVAWSARNDTLAARNRWQALEARALAEAGLARAVLELAQGSAERWPEDGREQAVSLGDGELRVGLRAADGLLDLNRGGAAGLGALLQVTGVAEDRAQALVDAVLDWRDGDELRRLHGAEAQDYRAAGLDYGPRNDDFRSLEELRLVLGMDRELYARLRPHLTLWSSRPAPNPRNASRALLLAQMDGDAERVEQYLAAREALPGAPSVGPWHLRSSARGPSGGQATLSAVVERTAQGGWRIHQRTTSWSRNADG